MGSMMHLADITISKKLQYDENVYRLVRVLGQIDQVKQGAHALDLSHQDIPISERYYVIDQ